MTQRVYVIGYPLGGGLSTSLQDSLWLDANDRYLHYRTPTEPGSAGSPVFDQSWTLLGLHHAGRRDMPRLRGGGTYEANEGIAISAVQQATRSSGPIFLQFWELHKLTLENFRCFEKIELNFSHKSTLKGRWNCIAGINGAGKSSILQAICIAMLGKYAQELGGNLLKRMRRISGDPNLPAEIKMSLRSPRSTEVREAELQEAEVWEAMVQIDDRGVVPQTMRAAPISTLLLAYGAARNLDSEQEITIKSRSPQVQHVYSLFAPLTQLPSAEILLSQRPRSGPLFAMFAELIRHVFRQELTLVEDRENPGLAQFKVMDSDQTGAADLPDGFRSSAAWLVDLCAAWCDKRKERATDNPADIEAIVLIDEIDLHLHPSLQREFVPRLREALPKVQWIVTTHSPLVLANFDANEIIALDRNSAGNVRKLDRQILGWTTDEIYEWLMGTEPTGTAIEGLLEKSGGNEAARLLRTSPTTDAEEAEQKAAESRRIWKSLGH